jgi:hypothetical protein
MPATIGRSPCHPVHVGLTFQSRFGPSGDRSRVDPVDVRQQRVLTRLPLRQRGQAVINEAIRMYLGRADDERLMRKRLEVVAHVRVGERRDLFGDVVGIHGRRSSGASGGSHHTHG